MPWTNVWPRCKWWVDAPRSPEKKGRNLTNKHYLSQVKKIHINRGKSCGWCAPLFWCDEVLSSLLGSSCPKPTISVLSWENWKINPNTGHSTKHQTSIHQHCQNHQTQEKSETLSQPRGVWGDTMTKGNAGSWWMGSWDRKRTSEKNWKGNWRNYGL